MASLYAASGILFWVWFRPLERPVPVAIPVAAAAGD
jgi:hypothetical protein